MGINNVPVDGKTQYYKDVHPWDFPGGAVVKNLPADAGDTGLNPGPGRCHMPRSN